MRSVFQTYDGYRRNLLSEFVICPVDKAGSSIDFKCKKFYLEFIGKELENTPTYEKDHNECEAEIFQKQVEYCKGFKGSKISKGI